MQYTYFCKFLFKYKLTHGRQNFDGWTRSDGWHVLISVHQSHSYYSTHPGLLLCFFCTVTAEIFCTDCTDCRASLDHARGQSVRRFLWWNNPSPEWTTQNTHNITKISWFFLFTCFCAVRSYISTRTICVLFRCEKSLCDEYNFYGKIYCFSLIFQ